MVREGVAAAIREGDGGELAALVGRLDGMGQVCREEGLQPAAVGAEDVLAAVEGVQLPAAGRSVDEVQLAKLVGRRAVLVEAQAGAGGGVGELAEAAVAGEQPDMVGVGIDDDPLGEVMRPESAEGGAPGGRAGKGVGSHAARGIADLRLAEPVRAAARAAAGHRHGTRRGRAVAAADRMADRAGVAGSSRGGAGGLGAGGRGRRRAPGGGGEIEGHGHRLLADKGRKRPHGAGLEQECELARRGGGARKAVRDRGPAQILEDHRPRGAAPFNEGTGGVVELHVAGRERPGRASLAGEELAVDAAARKLHVHGGLHAAGGGDRVAAGNVEAVDRSLWHRRLTTHATAKSFRHLRAVAGHLVGQKRAGAELRLCRPGGGQCQGRREESGLSARCRHGRPSSQRFARRRVCSCASTSASRASRFSLSRVNRCTASHSAISTSPP